LAFYGKRYKAATFPTFSIHRRFWILCRVKVGDKGATAAPRASLFALRKSSFALPKSAREIGISFAEISIFLFHLRISLSEIPISLADLYIYLGDTSIRRALYQSAQAETSMKERTIEAVHPTP